MPFNELEMRQLESSSQQYSDKAVAVPVMMVMHVLWLLHMVVVVRVREIEDVLQEHRQHTDWVSCVYLLCKGQFPTENL